MLENPSDLEYHLCLIHNVVSPNNTWTFYKAGNKEVIKVDAKLMPITLFHYVKLR